jgi:uncharacterized protein (TIGR03437 family)
MITGESMKSTLALKRSVKLGLAASALLLLCGAALIAATVKAEASQQAVTVVSAATFASDGTLAPDAIAAAFGQFITQNNQVFVAGGLPLPTTLGGITVRINGAPAPLLFVAPGQINLVIPTGAVDGPATIVVESSDASTSSGMFTIVRSHPAIFMASVEMRSASAQTTKDGINFLFTSNADGTLRDVDAGSAAEPNFLILYATGLRYAPADNPADENGIAEGVSVTFLGVPGQVTYAGPAPGFEGLDQVNVVIPRELAGLGIIDVKILIEDGLRESNSVRIRLGGQRPPVMLTRINPDEVVTGALTADDQLEVVGDNVYFLDAYFFDTDGANVNVVIDLRSPAPGAPEGAPSFDPAIFLYRIVDDRLEFVAIDDQSGGIGTPDFFSSGTQCLLDPYDNNNALLMTVLALPGRYALIVSSSDFDPLGVGSYTVEVRPNRIQPIAYGANIQGSIDTTDILTSAGTYIDVFAFNGNQGDTVEATMTSQSGAFLLLQTNDGEVIDFSDQNCMLPGTTARITHQLPRQGTYIVIAYSPTLNTTGPYNFSLQRLANLVQDAHSGANRSTGRNKIFYEKRDPNGTFRAYTPGTIVDRAARRRILH